MKDGDKAKAKAAKAKTSGKEVSSKGAAHEKGGKAVKGAGKKESISPPKASKKIAGVKASPKDGAKADKAGSSGKTSRAEPGVVSFTNPAIESAFKRAVKKYPNAFRRLTD